MELDTAMEALNRGLMHWVSRLKYQIFGRAKAILGKSFVKTFAIKSALEEL